jgi:hypothetical protein
MPELIASGLRSLSRSGLMALACLGAAVSGAGTASYSDIDVKAAFLLRFASYVSWPGEDSTPSPLQIAVLGSPETAGKLRAMVDDRSGANRSVGVRTISSLEEARGAHMLYVGSEHRADSRALPLLADGRGLLVITDSARGLAAGGAINFLTVDRRVRFEVSLEAARRANLSISSELLAVAARVEGSRPRPP